MLCSAPTIGLIRGASFILTEFDESHKLVTDVVENATEQFDTH